MNVEIRTSLTSLTSHIIIPLAKDRQLKKHLSTIGKWTGLGSTILQRDFNAEKGKTLSFYFKKNKKLHTIYLLGVGDALSNKNIETVFRAYAIQHRKYLKNTLGIYILDDSTLDTPDFLEAMASGLQLGTYDIGLFKTNNHTPHPLATEKTTLIGYLPEKTDIKEATNAMYRGIAIGETTKQILNLVNAPSNKKLPETLANWALKSGEKYGYSVKVLDKKEILEQGLHALLAVNRGSEYQPAFIIMEYQPNQEQASEPLPTIGLVGKGVTFDTGGLSIKGARNMHYMKSDMGGAAAVLGTMEAAARLRVDAHLIGIIPTTDNAVDAMSIKPGDIIDSYSGKTIEVIDTDAEGRLILADGLAYILKNYNPDVLIDLATLTGSCVRALGYEAAGLFSNNEQLADALIRSGQASGEKLWQLPLWDSYFEGMKSDVADIKNLAAIPVAGAIAAAKFLEFFIDKHPTWAHLDIAGVAFGNSPLSKDKSATGFGIKLLLEFVKKWK